MPSVIASQGGDASAELGKIHGTLDAQLLQNPLR